MDDLERRVAELERKMAELPSTELLSPSFMTRAFAVWGHNFVAGALIGILLAFLWRLFS